MEYQIEKGQLPRTLYFVYSFEILIGLKLKMKKFNTSWLGSLKSAFNICNILLERYLYINK